MVRSKSDLRSEIVDLTGSLSLNECCLCHAKNINECKIGGEFSIHWRCLKLCQAITEIDANY